MAKKKINGERASAAPAPSFFGWQLITCKSLNASPDVIRALLDADKQYTLEEAREIIDNFMNRKV